MPKKSSRPAPRPTDTARKIWLAGIGAYGRAFSDAQESLAKMSGDTSRVFDELVAKGEEIEETVEAHGRELAKRVAPGSFSIDDRIKQMRARLQNDEEADDSRLAEIENRLSAIEEKLDVLIASTAKPAAKKTSTKRPTKKKSS